jgi:hypothetical protein
MLREIRRIRENVRIFRSVKGEPNSTEIELDETSLFIHFNLVETSPRGRLAPNPRYELKRETSIQQEEQAHETQGFVTGVQPHTLRSTSPLRYPQRVDLYT